MERTRRRLGAVACLVGAVAMLSGCKEQIPPEALQLSAESLELRQLQTRRFDTTDEAKILAAAAGVLQDLGFTLDESETKLGLVVASKDRDAVETGQVVAAVVVAVLFGVAMAIDNNQKIRVSLVTRPVGETVKGTAVRVTFQRLVWNTRNDLSKIEGLAQPELYQEFFEKLSKAVFLEAHAI